MPANKQFKDSMFSFLFGNPDNLRELYSAIKGVCLPHDARIDINTLSDMLFKEQINDLSFTVDNRLVVLIEHQSTINPNMPLRLLEYIAHVYEKITNHRKLYQPALVKIPEPEFIVLYNGMEEYPDYKELRLSDAFMDAGGLKGNKDIALELIARVYNINRGRNPEILKRSGTLDGYSFFVEKVRECQKTLSFDAAFRDAVKYCIDHGIMKQFFEEHGSEVYNMALWGWDVEEERAALYEEGIEQGVERGREQVARNALAEGASFDFVQKITGLSPETIANL